MDITAYAAHRDDAGLWNELTAELERYDIKVNQRSHDGPHADAPDVIWVWMTSDHPLNYYRLGMACGQVKEGVGVVVVASGPGARDLWKWSDWDFFHAFDDDRAALNFILNLYRETYS